MKNNEIIKQLETETSVSLEEWKEIVILTDLTSDIPVREILQKRYELQKKYIEFLINFSLKKN
ncbi:MAG: hypothetical protein APR54_03640 [Candidatus Cloacimonas sp. SDB]|nr:MAG: hypothetical protein APR54_03640 [Candidatus Cloacimonas sp. SDB]